MLQLRAIAQRGVPDGVELAAGAEQSRRRFEQPDRGAGVHGRAQVKRRVQQHDVGGLRRQCGPGVVVGHLDPLGKAIGSDRRAGGAHGGGRPIRRDHSAARMLSGKRRGENAGSTAEVDHGGAHNSGVLPARGIHNSGILPARNPHNSGTLPAPGVHNSGKTGRFGGISGWIGRFSRVLPELWHASTSTTPELWDGSIRTSPELWDGRTATAPELWDGSERVQEHTRPDVQARTRENPAVCGHGQHSDPGNLLLRVHRERRLSPHRQRTRCDNQPRLLLRPLRLNPSEIPPEHIVLRKRHVLHAPARDKADVGRGPAGHGIRYLFQFGKRLRQLQQHKPRPAEQLGIEVMACEPAEPESGGIALERTTSGEEILMNPDAGKPLGRQPQRHRAILVADDGDFTRRNTRGKRPLRQQTVGRVVREKVRRFNVGGAPQLFPREPGHAVTLSRAHRALCRPQRHKRFLTRTTVLWLLTQVTNRRTRGAMIEEGKPLFLQIAEMIEDSIIDGSLAEEAQAPSTNELAAFYRINPATAAKGVTMLTEKGVLSKRRGIGMFVASGARELLLGERRAAFAERFVDPLLAEARTLGLNADDLTALLRERAGDPASEGNPT